MSNNDTWKVSSGLPLDGAEVEVTDAEFGYNADVGAGVVCMNMTFKLIDEDDQEPIEQSFSVGKQGEPSRDGKRLDSPPRRGYPARSNYGRLVESVAKIVDDPGAAIGSAHEAEGWIGTKWVMGTTPIVSTNPTTGEEKTRDALVFVEYLGKEDGGKKESKRAGKTAASKAGGGSRVGGRSKAKVEDDEVEDAEAGGAEAEGGDSGYPDAPRGIDQDLWEKLIDSARDADEHEAWSDEALEWDEVESNRAAQKAVLSTKAGSVWASK